MRILLVLAVFLITSCATKAPKGSSTSVDGSSAQVPTPPIPPTPPAAPEQKSKQGEVRPTSVK